MTWTPNKGDKRIQEKRSSNKREITKGIGKKENKSKSFFSVGKYLLGMCEALDSFPTITKMHLLIQSMECLLCDRYCKTMWVLSNKEWQWHIPTHRDPKRTGAAHSHTHTGYYSRCFKSQILFTPLQLQESLTVTWLGIHAGPMITLPLQKTSLSPMLIRRPPFIYTSSKPRFTWWLRKATHMKNKLEFA